MQRWHHVFLPFEGIVMDIYIYRRGWLVLHRTKRKGSARMIVRSAHQNSVKGTDGKCACFMCVCVGRTMTRVGKRRRERESERKGRGGDGDMENSKLNSLVGNGVLIFFPPFLFHRFPKVALPAAVVRPFRHVWYSFAQRRASL